MNQACLRGVPVCDRTADMKKSISLCLVCASLFALGSCVTETERTRTVSTTTKTSPATASMPDRNTTDYASMNGPMGSQPR